MSIFPKRAIPGGSVTIHWNFNTLNRSNELLFPYVKIAVRRPDGKVDLLFEGNVVSLPSTQLEEKTEKHNNKGQLQKHTPILVLADYLSGKHKRERLVQILEGIETGRHYYFSYPLKEDAPLGKYSILSEIHLEGQVTYSKTVDEDFFYVEKVVIEKKDFSEKSVVEVYNPSPEIIPIMIVETKTELSDTGTRTHLINLSPKKTTRIDLDSNRAFLLYNEEREVIALAPYDDPQLIRNQTLLSINKEENGDKYIYVLEKEEEDAYKLEGLYQEIWSKANGISCLSEVKKETNQEEFDEMIEAQLIKELKLAGKFNNEPA